MNYRLIVPLFFRRHAKPAKPDKIPSWIFITGLTVLDLIVDYILGEMETAIEVKGSLKVHSGHTKGLRALSEEYTLRRAAVIVSLEKEPRIIHPHIEILPWQSFLEELWSGGFGV